MVDLTGQREDISALLAWQKTTILLVTLNGADTAPQVICDVFPESLVPSGPDSLAAGLGSICSHGLLQSLQSTERTGNDFLLSTGGPSLQQLA